MDDSAVLELDGHRLVVQLHQEPANPRPNPHRFVRKFHQTSQRSEPNRGKVDEPGMLAYLTSFILEALGGGRRGGGKARAFAGGAAASSCFGARKET
jgi:hypothetical protein